MSTSTSPLPGPAPDAIVDAEPTAARPYSRVLLTAGLLGRAWLWFVVGCVAITLLPILIGWRPYVIESGSMEPRIHVGDVVLASPDKDPQQLLGHVTVFTDPAHPQSTKTHRVVQVAADGTLVTKGDANPTNDSVHVPMSDVRGLGRLLVRFVGLPLIWLQTGKWLWLLLLVASLVGGAYVVSRDREDDEPAGPPQDPQASSGPADADVVPFSSPRTTGGSGQVAATSPLPPQLQRSAAGRRPASEVGRWARRAGYSLVLVAALIIPTAQAAFSATTRSLANSWSVPNYDYTAQVTALNPWLYWKLDETSGTTAADSSGNNRPGAYAGSITKGVAGALTSHTPNLAVTLNDSAACINTKSGAAVSAPTSLTEIVWFKTADGYDKGGKLLGFETPRTGVGLAGSGGTYDRHLYMDGAGLVWFGVYQGGDQLLHSAAPLNNDAWHMAAATLSAAGMALYIDGVLVASNSDATGEATTGWWRAGCGNLAGWGDGWTGPNGPSTSSDPAKNFPFRGSLDEVSVWTSALTAAQISFLYFTH
jgi:signal peptidase I